jgi:hypothetical protein
VRWYLEYKLSSRDISRLLAEWEISVDHSTVLRWVRRYAPEFEKKWHRYGFCRVSQTEPVCAGRGYSRLGIHSPSQEDLDAPILFASGFGPIVANRQFLTEAERLFDRDTLRLEFARGRLGTILG